jgi:hypothetical protein
MIDRATLSHKFHDGHAIAATGGCLFNFDFNHLAGGNFISVAPVADSCSVSLQQTILGGNRL